MSIYVEPDPSAPEVPFVQTNASEVVRPCVLWEAMDTPLFYLPGLVEQGRSHLFSEGRGVFLAVHCASLAQVPPTFSFSLFGFANMFSYSVLMASQLGWMS
jgi:hypothetical protein